MIYTGVVENRYDPLKLGRCQVRIIGLHTHDKQKLPTEDLPWAYPMQSITSAAMSGIGSTPLGLVEGTSVLIAFQDVDLQYPIMIGSLGGIPQKSSSIDVDDSTLKLMIDGELKQSNEQSNVIIDGNGNALLDSNGAPVTSTQPEPTLVNTNSLKRAIEFTASQQCIELIKRFEGLRLTSYQDSIGKWTIGYGTTIINGQPVVEGMNITTAQANEYLLFTLNTDHAPAVKRNVRALITQSMFDALCCFTYNVGSGNFAKSTLLKDLNTSKYLDAAAGFLQWDKAGGVILAGLTKRRIAEKDLFLNDGIPNSAGELPPSETTTTTTGTTTTTTSGATQSISSTSGFVDPKGKYPLYINEPDTNRLARHEEISKTIVYKKDAALDTGIPTSTGSSWDQSPNPYNATYPFNHVMMTESGHILEFDDTPNSERIHLYHKSGTFTEIDANGTQVNRIVGDGYEILERNGYVHINGSLNVTVDGANNTLVKNTYNLTVNGVANINVMNDANLFVSGDLNASVGNAFRLRAHNVFIEGDTVDIKSNGHLKVNGSTIDAKADGACNIEGGGEVSVKAGGNAKFDGAQVHLGMGANSAAAASPSGVDSPAGVVETSMPEFNKLTVITRGSSAAGVYETPDEGDASVYQQKQINSGAIKSEEIAPVTKIESAPTETNTVTALPKSCDIISMKQTFEPSFKLSTNYTLSALTSNGSRMPVAQQGISAQEIVCNLKGLSENVLEVIRNYYPNFVITSAFRRPGDVAASSKTSDHYLGCAVDIVIPNANRNGHYDAIKRIQQLVPYDQLLLEYQGSQTVWIHISYKYTGNKKQVFTMKDHKRISDFGQFTLVA
jgi:GH24 family phage-related lysozyme (muramidase)